MPEIRRWALHLEPAGNLGDRHREATLDAAGTGSRLRPQPPPPSGGLNSAESDHPTEPHYYLPFLGVEPENQGRGMGSALMHPVLSRCDADRTAAYLESSTPRNRALYERHGFEVMSEFKLGSRGPSLWRMWRGAR